MAASNSAGQRRPTSKANGVKRLRLIQASQSGFSVAALQFGLLLEGYRAQDQTVAWYRAVSYR